MFEITYLGEQLQATPVTEAIVQEPTYEHTAKDPNLMQVALMVGPLTLVAAGLALINNRSSRK